MAFPLTPELQQAGAAALAAPTPVTAPSNTTAAPIPAPTPVDQGTVGQDTLSGDYSVPAFTPAPNSFGAKLAQALDKNPIPMKPNGQPQPGGWARSIVGATQNVLAGLGDSANIDLKPGQGALTGVMQTLAARNQRLQAQQAAQAKQKQQGVENDFHQKELEQKDLALKYEGINAEVASRKLSRDLDTDAQNRMAASEKSWETAKKNAGAVVEQEGLTGTELADLAKQNGGMSYIANRDYHQDGWRDITDKNGNPVPVLGKDGQPTGENQREPTYALLSYGEPLTVDADMAAQIKKYLHKDITEGTTLAPADARLIQSRVNLASSQEEAANKAAVEAGASEEQMAELNDKKGKREAGEALAPYIISNKGDSNAAMKQIQDASKMTDDKGNPTPGAVEAQKSLDTITKFYGQDLVQNAIKVTGEEDVKRVEENIKNANKKSEEMQGDTSLSGDAYLNSLPAGEKQTVQLIGNGRLPVARLEYLLARNPAIVQETALAFGEKLDMAKMPAYIEASKQFTTGTKIANQLNSANTSLVHLKSLFDDNNKPGAFIGGNAYAQRQVDLTDASTELARFLTGGTAPSKQDIENARASLDPSIFRSLDPQSAKQAAVKEQADRINEKIQEYQRQWGDALPSPTWTKPMPGGFASHPEAAQALSYIQNDGKVPQDGMTHLTDANGTLYRVPTANVNAVLTAHPGLKAQQ